MTYISANLRREVMQRAHNCCEYCRVSQEDHTFAHEVDHIIAEKHGGATTTDNLCLSCYLCNGHKGSDIGGIDWDGTKRLTPLFDPRQQNWDEHFELNLERGRIEPRTPEGRVTIFVLKLNTEERIRFRQELIEMQRYPCRVP